MRRPLVSLLVLVAACSGATDTSTTTSEPPPTTTASPPTLIPGGLIPADPATLVPFEDAVPVLLGNSHQGVVAPGGRWAAVQTEQSGESNPLISIIDLNSLIVVADQEGSGEGLQVGDDGSAVWFEDGQLHRLEITSQETTVDSPSAPPYFVDTLSTLSDGRVGYLSGPVDQQGPVSVVVVDDDAITIHELSQIAAGPVAPADAPGAHRGVSLPDVAWDVTNNRAMVISADDDSFVVVDLESGATTEHEFATGGPSPRGAARNAYATDDGSTLFVATKSLDSSPDGTGSVESAEQLVVIDTSDWSSRLVSVTADTIYPSPGGSVIATSGAEVAVDAESNEERSQSPVFLVDTATGEPIVGFEGRSGEIVDVQFSNDGAEMYVISEGTEGTNIDIVDVASEQLAGSLGFARISLIGEAGLISFHMGDD